MVYLGTVNDQVIADAPRSGWRRKLPIVIVLVSILALFFIPQWGGQKTRMERWLQDFTHFPLFATITAFLIALWRHHGPVLEKALGVALAALVLIVGVEVIQPVVGRSASIADVIIGLAGASTSVMVYLSLKARSLSGRRWLVACTGLLSCAAMVPLMIITADWYRAVKEFPIIDSFEQKMDLGRWLTHCCEIDYVQENATDGSSSLKLTVTGTDRDPPSIFLDDGVADWRGFSRLSVDVYVPGTENRVIWFRADDKVFPKYHDRSQMSFEVRPGWNTIWVDLHVFRQTPSGRLLDLGHITTFGFFLEDARIGDSIYFDRLYLSGSTRTVTRRRAAQL